MGLDLLAMKCLSSAVATILHGERNVWSTGSLYGDEQYGFIEWENDFLVIEDGVKMLTPFDASLWIVDAS